MRELLTRPRKTMSLLGAVWPKDYGDTTAERRALAQGAALLDFSPMDWLRLTGSDTASFLQGMVSQDIRRIGLGEARPAWLLDAGGKILFSLHIIHAEAQTFLLQTSPGEAETVSQGLDRFLIMEDVALAQRPSWRCLSLQGPMAEALLAEVNPGDALVYAHDRSGAGGFDLAGEATALASLAEALVQAGAVPTGMAALNGPRIRAFIPWYGVDMKPGVNPVIYGSADRISAEKGCYVGQELVAMTRDRGRPPQLLSLLRGTDPAPAEELALVDGDKPIGAITSATEDDSGAWALATVKYQFVRQPKAVLTDARGGRWTVERTRDEKAT